MNQLHSVEAQQSSDLVLQLQLAVSVTMHLLHMVWELGLRNVITTCHYGSDIQYMMQHEMT